MAFLFALSANSYVLPTPAVAPAVRTTGPVMQQWHKVNGQVVPTNKPYGLPQIGGLTREQIMERARKAQAKEWKTDKVEQCISRTNKGWTTN